MEVPRAAGAIEPVGRFAEDRLEPHAEPDQRAAYFGQRGLGGTGEFVVTSTGMATEVGHISGMLQGQTTEETPLTPNTERGHKRLQAETQWLEPGKALESDLVLGLRLL